MKIVTDFNIVDPDDTGIDAVYIQISSGYVAIRQFILSGIIQIFQQVGTL
jgi:hypothetical protein